MSLTKKWQTFHWKNKINKYCLYWIIYPRGNPVTCDESMKTSFFLERKFTKKWKLVVLARPKVSNWYNSCTWKLVCMIKGNRPPQAKLFKKSFYARIGSMNIAYTRRIRLAPLILDQIVSLPLIVERIRVNKQCFSANLVNIWHLPNRNIMVWGKKFNFLRFREPKKGQKIKILKIPTQRFPTFP